MNTASRSDETLTEAGRALRNVRAGNSIGTKSAALKRKHYWSKMRNAAFAVGAVLVGASVIGLVIDGLGFSGVMATGLIGAAAAYLLMRFPGMPMPTLDTLRTTDLTTLAGKTEIWLESQRRALPAPAVTLIDGIGTRLDELAPQLATLDEKEPAAREVRKLVGEHLPDLINGYKRIPDTLKRKDNKGKTPEEQLVSGLKLIDREIESVTGQIARGELDQLAINERYLELRYDGVGEG
ncbi:MAG: hypothetical protein V3V15_00460 [Sphingorhabdus sp.]